MNANAHDWLAFCDKSVKAAVARTIEACAVSAEKFGDWTAKENNDCTGAAAANVITNLIRKRSTEACPYACEWDGASPSDSNQNHHWCEAHRDECPKYRNTQEVQHDRSF